MPAKHGSGADAPRGQNEPPGQALQAVEPGASWKLPAAHDEHSAWRVVAANVPGAHGACALEAVGHIEPFGHAEHSGALVRLATFEYEPAGHGSSAEAPSGQKLPPLQGLQPTAPSWSWNEPAGHLVHEPALDASMNVPAAQSVELLEPVGLKDPGVELVHCVALDKSVRYV